MAMTPTPYPLGRVHRVDKRDLAYPMHLGLVSRLRARVSRAAKVWTTGPVQDQGQTPHCVGFAGLDYLLCAPNVAPVPPGTTGDSIYYQCKVVDGEAGAEDGSDARSLMKVFTRQGLVKSYVWAQKPADISNWLLLHGPVLLGTPWKQQMFSPDQNGRVYALGQTVGGHEYLAHGYDPQTRLVTCLNSWGRSWGMGGHFTISLAGLWALINEGGDAVAASEV